MAKKMKKNNNVYFKDNAIQTISFEDKVEIHDGKVVSIRDGVMEYMGAEIGKEPLTKIFKVYRSPKEVERIASSIVGIPITDGHIEPYGEIEESLKHGEVKTFSFVDAEENELNSTLAVQHDIKLDENMLQFIQDQKPESSLGYTGKLVPSEDYDFEQVDLVPHHLAVVTAGRCGKICKFKDGEVKNFLNEDGTLDLKAFVEAVKSAMEKADDSQKSELSKEFSDMFGKPEKVEVTDMEKEEMKAEAVEEVKKDDEFMDSIRDEAIKTFKDSDEYKEATSVDSVEAFKDSDGYRKAIEEEATLRANIVSKASPFLDKAYDFKDKSTCEIMADTLKAEFSDKSFTDEQVPVAFEMLEVKNNAELKNFGDAGISKLDEVFGKVR